MRALLITFVSALPGAGPALAVGAGQLAASEPSAGTEQAGKQSGINQGCLPCERSRFT
jgi:hypothetical protein